MEASPQVVEVASQLAQAVNTTLDPSVSHAVRLASYNLLEKVKEESELAVGCGFYLAHRDREPVVRHLGLQLLEHAIRYKWNDLSVQQKVYIKENSMQLVAEGTLDLLSEHLYVKDKVSRLVVEMMKREWPQHWPGLLEELHQLSKRGPTQTELVLFVFLRIAEDVATLQNLESNQRRRDLYQAMTANMESVFGFFLSLLEENYTQYKAHVGQQDSVTALCHCRVMQVVLMTLTVYVEWVSVQYIFAEDGKLLQSLCFLLSEDSVKKEAAECLLQIVSRKGKADERRPLLLLFAEAPMSAVFNAADQAVMGPLSEHNYRFLKTLTQVLTGLGSQLCTLWVKEGDVGEPPNFRVYLDAMLAFTRHPSLHIYNYTNSLWGQLFRHDQVPLSKTLRAILPVWITIVSQKVMKHGYPSKNDSESCQYSLLDFDSDEEYSHFFYKVRSETLETIKAASLLAPDIMYTHVEEWLTSHVKKTASTSTSDKQLCNLFSPSYLEWDALSQVVESVMSRVMQSSGWKPSAESGLKLLQLCLAYETTDPLILSTLLSCISGLFIFIRLVPSVLSEILNKIFSALTFSLPGQTKDSRSRAVKNVRRHGCSLMVKIARDYPDILIEAFDFINSVVDSLSHNPQELSQMEKVTLQESLLITNNNFHNFDKQSSFISKVLSPVSVIWVEMKQAFSSPLEFMSFVGLDKAPVEPSENDVNGQNRAQIIFCVNLILAVIKRSEFPSDHDKAERGGFVLERSEGGAVVCRNPATPHVMPLLHQLFCLARLFNCLWHPEAIASVSVGYAKAHNLPDAERNNILGLANSSNTDRCADSPKVQQPLERMQHFLAMMHDNCYHILGNAGPSLGLQFYQHPHLTDYIIHSSLANLALIPDYRLRPIIRTFLKPFIQWCPPQCYQTVLLPILNHLCPYMLERLSVRWGHLSSLIESGSYEEENTDTQEMLEDLLIRMLTREYIDLLKVVLIGGPRGRWQQDSGEGMDTEMEVCSALPVTPEALSELGQLVLGCDTICQAIVTTLLKVLWWQDSGACLKAVGVVGQVLRWLAGEGQHLSPEAVQQVMMAVLRGLHTHGQHDANQSALLSLGLATYEMFRPNFPNIREVLIGLPGVTAEDVQSFEEKLQASNQNPNIKSSKLEKVKKDVFKKLITEIVGRNIGQAFKKEVHMNNLPPMFKAPRPKQPRVDDSDSDIGLCSLFGPEVADTNGHQVT
uniref:Importin N-terminal domain-containing protein n=1 Tax=Scylla olivacea TaxID=85551 RepID=A0A0P4W0G1_SCYOL